MPTPPGRPEWTQTSTRREGRYLLGPLLGHGGMGDVVQAWDTVLNRIVALKILTQVDPASMVRFVHEAQLQARLEHPGICRIYDIEVQGGVPRIAMQWIQGPTLEDASPDLPLETCVTLVAEMAQTLAFAHRHGLVHRDIKPGNVLLEPLEDGSWRPVLCDFGLALALQESQLTQPNALTGTPAYMAPEQVRGDRRLVGPATDVYALGGTLYFLLVGRPPCVATVTREMIRVKRELRFPSPRMLEPSVPADLEAILLRCLQPEVEERYPSMEALAEDLWSILGGPRPAMAPPRRRPWGRIVGIAAMGLLATGLSMSAWRERHPAEAINEAYLEAHDLEQALAVERARAAHDLRPALGRLRPRGEADPSGALVRGSMELALERFPEARADLAQAWSQGATRPETAFGLGMACAEGWLGPPREGNQPDPALKREAAAWFQRARGLSPDRRELAQAMVAFLDQDLDGALAHARASQTAQPWSEEAPLLGSRILLRQASLGEQAGHPAWAQAAYLQATAWLDEPLRRTPSDPRLHHVNLRARLGLARLARQTDQDSPADQTALETLAARALALDPEDPRAREDWQEVQAFRN
jgi:eukaryotic-like serine/threonine-protein kinase